jgi:hypothetical protein
LGRLNDIQQTLSLTSTSTVSLGEVIVANLIPYLLRLEQNYNLSHTTVIWAGSTFDVFTLVLDIDV